MVGRPHNTIIKSEVEKMKRLICYYSGMLATLCSTVIATLMWIKFSTEMTGFNRETALLEDVLVLLLYFIPGVSIIIVAAITAIMLIIRWNQDTYRRELLEKTKVDPSKES